ncbi:dihydroneopterin aldolase [Atopomonas hussainii]|uniref:7,8-dihydroneopterin aldolase n=1 Tax=Atopomonas hussainii TaxID=1429083 RepID=A0A1H7QQ83_9GAMM|nr:dihydroneopterin aldolase [Atopomonas hussainii]SEL50093.1 dihydroneopterin aldolase [Atopomonas hussainii]
MDYVLIEALEAQAVIGVYDWERNIRQRLSLDLTLGWDNRPAAQSDDLAKALDYAAVSARVTAFIEASSYQLVETLVEDLAALLMAEFHIPWLRIRLRKPGAVANAASVGVQIERGQRA